ncbi:MAG TPA: hypothetical protein VHY35_25345 [Stellaceae bacterium]|jgi:hypothetical protein|nr:hypothetical protein [Stellaceae bacterium]
MRRIGVSLIVLALSAVVAHAETPDAGKLLRRAETFVRSLFPSPRSPPDLIVPPADIDPQMVLTPPHSGGAPLSITPPGARR